MITVGRSVSIYALFGVSYVLHVIRQQHNEIRYKTMVPPTIFSVVRSSLRKIENAGDYISLVIALQPL